MANFIKKFLQGLIYLITFPIYLVVLAVFAVYGLFLLVTQFIRLIYNFFTGRSIKGELPEDIQARAIIRGEQPQEKPVEKAPENVENIQKEASSAEFYEKNGMFYSRNVEVENQQNNVEQNVAEPTIEESIFSSFEPEPEPINEEDVPMSEPEPIELETVEEEQISPTSESIEEEEPTINESSSIQPFQDVLEEEAPLEEETHEEIIETYTPRNSFEDDDDEDKSSPHDGIDISFD